jgi:membrane fusion protein (multidrug efflux system)
VLALAQAETAKAIAEAQLTQLQTGPRTAEIEVAEAQLASARVAISQTLAQREQLDAGSFSAQLDASKARVAAAEAERFVANQQHEDAMKCYDIQQPDGTDKRVCPTLGTIEEQTRMAMLAADAGLLAAQTQLRVLYSEHNAQIDVAKAAIQAAEAQAVIAETQLSLLKAAVSSEAIAVASAVVDQAQVAVEMAHLALDRTVVRAPLSGVVGYIDTREGEVVNPGIPLLIVGDVTSLRVETTDLDEIDVGQIELGQEAVITFEALPDETFTGTVNHIAPMANPGGGGVNYTVYLALNSLHPQLRWGMTAFIDIVTPE